MKIFNSRHEKGEVSQHWISSCNMLAKNNIWLMKHNNNIWKSGKQITFSFFFFTKTNHVSITMVPLQAVSTNHVPITKHGSTPNNSTF